MTQLSRALSRRTLIVVVLLAVFITGCAHHNGRSASTLPVVDRSTVTRVSSAPALGSSGRRPELRNACVNGTGPDQYIVAIDCYIPYRGAISQDWQVKFTDMDDVGSAYDNGGQDADCGPMTFTYETSGASAAGLRVAVDSDRLRVCPKVAPAPVTMNIAVDADPANGPQVVAYLWTGHTWETDPSDNDVQVSKEFKFQMTVHVGECPPSGTTQFAVQRFAQGIAKLPRRFVRNPHSGVIGGTSSPPPQDEHDFSSVPQFDNPPLKCTAWEEGPGTSEGIAYTEPTIDAGGVSTSSSQRHTSQLDIGCHGTPNFKQGPAPDKRWQIEHHVICLSDADDNEVDEIVYEFRSFNVDAPNTQVGVPFVKRHKCDPATTICDWDIEDWPLPLGKSQHIEVTAYFKGKRWGAPYQSPKFTSERYILNDVVQAYPKVHPVGYPTDVLFPEPPQWSFFDCRSAKKSANCASRTKRPRFKDLVAAFYRANAGSGYSVPEGAFPPSGYPTYDAHHVLPLEWGGRNEGYNGVFVTNYAGAGIDSDHQRFNAWWRNFSLTGECASGHCPPLRGD